ncbi:MAG: SAM-dependent chlorinase/fluorinase [Bacteroidales bacterium]|nr:SAM-dependent chlorinase/fluorinase [Bacteroidales bacterium]
MPVVTIISDWSQGDYYLASLKGALLSALNGIPVVDIMHNVSSFHLGEAAFVLGNSYRRFPSGSVHLICVDTFPQKNRRFLAVKGDGHYFLTADNGVVGLLFPQGGMEVYEITSYSAHTVFPELDVFVPAAVHIAGGNDLKEIAVRTESWKSMVPILPVYDDGTITGSVVYIDSYRNAITNIDRQLFEKVGRGRPFEIVVQSNRYRLTRIDDSYGEITSGELMALFNAAGFLEIAIARGNAADLLGLDTQSVIRITFFNREKKG